MLARQRAFACCHSLLTFLKFSTFLIGWDNSKRYVCFVFMLILCHQIIFLNSAKVHFFFYFEIILIKSLLGLNLGIICAGTTTEVPLPILRLIFSFRSMISKVPNPRS